MTIEALEYIHKLLLESADKWAEERIRLEEIARKTESEDDLEKYGDAVKEWTAANHALISFECKDWR